MVKCPSLFAFLAAVFAVLVPGLSAQTLPKAVSAVSTSELEDDNIPGRYASDKLFDGDPRTAWVEGAEGDGLGERVRVTVHPPLNGVRYVQIMPGYFDPKWWKANNRVREASITLIDGEGRREEYVRVFEDVMEPQGFEVSERSVSSFEIVIRTVYPGDLWRDTCIADVSFYEWAPDPEASSWLKGGEYYYPVGKRAVFTAPGAEGNPLAAQALWGTVTEDGGVRVRAAEGLHGWSWQFARDGSVSHFRDRDVWGGNLDEYAELGGRDRLWELGMWRYLPADGIVEMVFLYRASRIGAGDYVPAPDADQWPGPSESYYTEYIQEHAWGEWVIRADWHQFQMHGGDINAASLWAISD